MPIEIIDLYVYFYIHTIILTIHRDDDSEIITSTQRPISIDETPVKRHKRNNYLDELANFLQKSDSDSDEATSTCLKRKAKSPTPIISSPIPSVRVPSPIRSPVKSNLFIPETSEIQTHISISSSPEKEITKLKSDLSEEILIKHNVLLSSPEKDFLTSSSIGEIKISNKPKDLSKIQKSTNDFLNKLNTKDAQNSKQLNILKNKTLEKEYGLQIDTSFSDPIQSTSINDSILISLDAECESAIEPSTVITKRAKTLDSNRSRLSKDERDSIKLNKELNKKNQKLFKELNKVKRTKVELLQEMIMNMPSQLIAMFTSNDFDLSEELESIQIKSISTKSFDENLIYWERKSNSRYDSEKDFFTPVEFHLIKESQNCYVFEILNFIKIIETKSIEEILDLFKSKKNIILLIGLDHFITKLKNIEYREYTRKVRENMSQSQSQPESQPKRKSKEKGPVTTLSIKEIESIISTLRINGVKIFPTKNYHEALLWLRSFTYTIASSRYDKFERNLEFANIGTIKSGINSQDTFEKMLLQFKRMSNLKLRLIVQEFQNFKNLLDFVNDGNNLSDININGELNLQITKFLKSLNENDILKS